jgi:uncharacterized membrane protein YhaH (DUF805 family)
MRGRVRRAEFWRFVLACVVIYVVAFILEAIIGRRVLTPIIGLALLLPIAGLGARRLQDTGKNGVLILAYTLPAAGLEVVSLLGAYRPYGMSGSLDFIFRLMGLVWLISGLVFTYFWAQPGTAGPNEYGPDPAAVSGPAPAAA